MREPDFKTAINNAFGNVEDRKIATARGLVASDVLTVMRRLRDNCPTQWDALIAADENQELLALWDRLRDLEKIVHNGPISY